MAGPSVVRGGMSTAIVPEGPALVYSATPRGANRENRGKCSTFRKTHLYPRQCLIATWFVMSMIPLVVFRRRLQRVQKTCSAIFKSGI